MPAQVMAVSMNKGGVGKTSLVTNLAGALSAKYNNKVLIIDLDGQGNTPITFGLVPDQIEDTIYDVLVYGKDPRDVILGVHENLHILPANSDMDFIEFDILPHLSNFPKPFEILKPYTESLKEYYDFIFIDTPPAMGLIQGNVLVAADKVLIPFVPEDYAVHGLLKINNAIVKFQESHNPNLGILGVVGMMVDSRTSLHSTMMQQARQFCASQNIHMFDTVVPRTIKFPESVNRGEPATWTKSKHKLIDSYYDLLKEIAYQL